MGRPSDQRSARGREGGKEEEREGHREEGKGIGCYRKMKGRRKTEGK